MSALPPLSDADRIRFLDIPRDGTLRMVLDTDTYNEIDDQFAVVYSLLARDRLNVEALYAAPFHNGRSNGPGDGMEKSYEEILRLLDRLDIDPQGFAYRGSSAYLPFADTPVKSDAARDLIDRAMSSGETLYVVAIGAPTNVASALLMEPQLAHRIVVLWLGGHAMHWPNTNEFNMKQDLHASRILLESGVPLVLFPCQGVTTHLHTTLPEIEAHVKGHGAIGDYLAEIYLEMMGDAPGRSKVLWDMIAIAYLVNPNWISTSLRHSPILTDQVTWSFDSNRHLIRYADALDRSAIFGDFFGKLPPA